MIILEAIIFLSSRATYINISSQKCSKVQYMMSKLNDVPEGYNIFLYVFIKCESILVLIIVLICLLMFAFFVLYNNYHIFLKCTKYNTYLYMLW